jgi:hypothetical protein
VKWDENLAVNAAGETFAILLTYANFGGNKQLQFDVTTKDGIDKDNTSATAEYNDKLAVEKEKLFYETLRSRLKLIRSVQPRPSALLPDH